MDALTFNDNNNNNPNTGNNSVHSPTDQDPNDFTKSITLNSTGPTGTSPRNYDSSFFNQDSTSFKNMGANNTVSDQSNQQPNSNSLDSRTRQDSISFYTNFGTNSNGPRFSTDSNSSISNFLNLPIPGDQNVSGYDSNGRGLSIINNFFNSNPTGSQQSSASSSGQQQPSINLSSQPQSGQQNYLPVNDFNSYSQIRRPSEQLEPFNPPIKLKNPSYTKKGSTSLIPGASFSGATSDFDFFVKRDSIKGGRQPSFLNNGSLGDSSDFDFFAKRDSIKNSDDFEFKEPNFNTDAKNKRETKSEPDTNDPRQSNQHQPIPAQPAPNQLNQQQQQQSNDLYANQEFRQPALPYNEYQQSSKLPPQPMMQQRIQPNQPFQQQSYQYPLASQNKVHANQQQQLQPYPIDDESSQGLSNTGSAITAKGRRNAVKSTTKKARKIVTNSSPHQGIQTQLANNTSLMRDQTSSQEPSPERIVHPIDPNSREEGRPLLGATKVDQLMLIIQARKKGIHKQIPMNDDGSIIDDGNGVLPQETELVGGIDKPKTKPSKNHECSYCHKTFTQSTHLEVHVRSHIGYKPFSCQYCGKKFTQGGNLRTHLRLHTGEKPYGCEICGKTFSRKGNLAAHKLTHDNLKPFECKLDDCKKSFTQLGNLKAHQNRFHLETLNRLTERLAEIDPNDASMKDEERDLLNYFATLYKNSNRGIKGRGRRPDNSESSPSQGALSGGENGHSQQLSQQQIDSNGLQYAQSFGYPIEQAGDSKNGSISFKSVNYQS